MMKVLSAITILLIQVSFVPAEEVLRDWQFVPKPGTSLEYAEVTTPKGVTWKDVKVIKATANSLKIVHAEGAATIPLAELPPAVQKAHHYDEASAAFERVTDKADAKAVQKRRDDARDVEVLGVRQHELREGIKKSAVRLSLLVRYGKNEGVVCRAWPLKAVRTNKRNISGEYEMTLQVSKDEIHEVFVVNKNAIRGTDLGVQTLYPYPKPKDISEPSYATSWEEVYEMRRNEITQPNK